MNRAPLILTIVLLLLPVLYVGSYLALVVPGGINVVVEEADTELGLFPVIDIQHYRAADQMAKFVFWPLERIDRSIRQGAWIDGIPL